MIIHCFFLLLLSDYEENIYYRALYPYLGGVYKNVTIV